MPLNVVKTFLYQLYIFQLEEYNTFRFIKTILNKGIFPNKYLRKKLIFTTKIKIIILISIIINVSLPLVATLLIFRLNEFNAVIFLICILIYLFLTYLLFNIGIFSIIISQIILYPIETIFKKRIIKKAKTKIKFLIRQNKSNIKIIAVTGSYGKTTMKEILFEILSKEFITVKTQNNNNTTLGISKTILELVNEQTEILIVEMGEYVKGDIKKLCKITPPLISIITGINEAHLERYKTMDKAISTKFEIVEYAQKNSVVLLNADDELVLNNYKRFIRKDQLILFYSSWINKNFYNKMQDLMSIEHINRMLKIKNYQFLTDGSGQEFEIYDDLNNW
ncbi:MAG: Mur ligase family protein, partial [Candidatus Dojkabacteria bacterium]|nr:Mur ligase family protein [Candidatus Dojkabacteria bacterium]